jgi:hypothetical protein
MAEDLSAIKARMGSVVTRGECTGKHKALEEGVSRSMSEVKEELRRGLTELKKGTGQSFPAITSAMLAAAAPAHEMTPEEMEAALAARAEEKAEKRRKLVSWYLGTAGAVLAILGVFGAFTYKVVLTLDRMQHAVSAQPDGLRRELQQIAAKQPKVIYLPAPPQPGRDIDDQPRRAIAPPRRNPR